MHTTPKLSELLQHRRGIGTAVVSLLVLLASGNSGAAQSNLLKNGNFEEGPDPGSFITLGVGSTAIPGWTVTKGTVDYAGTNSACPEGKRCIDLDGTPGPGGISQTFATSAGREYGVSFLMAANSACPPQIKRMQINAAGQSARFEFDTATNSPLAKTWMFRAKGNSTTIEFESLDPIGNCGPVLDDVAVFAGATKQKTLVAPKVNRFKLNGNWVYLGEGTTTIEQFGNNVRMLGTWTPLPIKGPHYEINATISGNRLSGRWRALKDMPSVKADESGAWNAIISDDGTTIRAVDVEDPHSLRMNEVILTRAPEAKTYALIGVWDWMCCGGKYSGKWQIASQHPDGTFSGKSLNTNSSDVGLINGRMRGGTIEFTRGSVPGTDQNFSQYFTARLIVDGKKLRMVEGRWKGSYDNLNPTDFSAEFTIPTHTTDAADSDSVVATAEGVLTVAAFDALPRDKQAVVLSERGPLLPPSFSMNDIPMRVFMKGDWPLVVAYSLSRGTAVLSIAAEGVESFSQVLTAGRNKQAVIRIPARFGERAQVAKLSIRTQPLGLRSRRSTSFVLQAIGIMSEKTKSADGSSRRVPFGPSGAGALRKTRSDHSSFQVPLKGKLPISQLTVAPGSIRTSKGEKVVYKFFSSSFYNSAEAEFFLFTLTQRGVVPVRVFWESFEQIRANEETEQRQWDGKNKKGQFSFGLHRLELRTWRTAKSGGEWFGPYFGPRIRVTK